MYEVPAMREKACAKTVHPSQETIDAAIDVIMKQADEELAQSLTDEVRKRKRMQKTDFIFSLIAKRRSQSARRRLVRSTRRQSTTTDALFVAQS